MKQTLIFILLFTIQSVIAQEEIYTIKSDTNDKLIISPDGSFYEHHYYNENNILTAILRKTLSGVFEGEAIWFYENGKVKTIGSCKNNLHHGEFKSFYITGELKSNAKYANGKQHGLVQKYYKNGQLYSSKKMKNGKIVGSYIRHYANGNKEFEFKNKGNKTGIRYLYTPEGDLRNGEHRVELIDEVTFIANAINGIAHGNFKRIKRDKLLWKATTLTAIKKAC